MSHEKRKEQRVKEDFSMLCKLYRKTPIQGSVPRILDISKSGLCMMSDSRFETGDIMQLIMRIPPDFKEKIEIFSRIIESFQTKNGRFKTRAVFIEVSPAAKASIEKIIQQANFKSALKRKE